MSYKGFIWPNNPQEITYTAAQAQSTALFPGGASSVRQVAERPRQVRGKGFFYGAQAQLWMNRLEQVFLEKEAGVLFLPNRRPLYARFTELTVLEQVKKDTVGYTFLFTEDRESGRKERNEYADYTAVRQGETLFDVAARTGVEVELLGTLNSFPGCFALEEGAQVRLK